MRRLRAFLPRRASDRADAMASIGRQLDQCVVLSAVNLILTAMVLAMTLRIHEALR
jgi:hypothetical protein